MKYHNKHLIWIGAGAIITFLVSVLVSLALHTVIWTSVMISSVNWNTAPV